MGGEFREDGRVLRPRRAAKRRVVGTGEAGVPKIVRPYKRKAPGRPILHIPPAQQIKALQNAITGTTYAHAKALMYRLHGLGFRIAKRVVKP